MFDQIVGQIHDTIETQCNIFFDCIQPLMVLKWPLKVAYVNRYYVTKGQPE